MANQQPIFGIKESLAHLPILVAVMDTVKYGGHGEEERQR